MNESEAKVEALETQAVKIEQDSKSTEVLASLELKDTTTCMHAYHSDTF